MTDAPGLLTLCYPIDPAQLGDLTIYPLSRDFLAAWDRLRDLVRERADREEINPTYSALATTLSAASGRPVRFFPRSSVSPEEARRGVEGLLVTTGILDPWLLSTTVRTFERRSVADPSADTLAPLLGACQPESRPLRAFISADPDSGAVRAPGWIYECARWQLAARLAARPLQLDGQLSIRLRLDTEGDLLAWDDPLVRPSKNSTGHAMVRISTKVITLPGASGLYLRLDGHVSRRPYTWRDVRNAWVDRGDPSLPIVKIPVLSPYPAKGRPHPVCRGLTSAVLESCQLDPISLPAEFPDLPGPVRPIGKPRKHSIGKGPGVRFLYQLAAHAAELLGTPPLAYAKTRVSVRPQTTGPIAPENLDASVLASGTEHLRIVCIYATSLIRRRMLDALATYCLQGPDHLSGVADATPIQLSDRCTVVFHRDPDLVRHGNHERFLDGVDALQQSQGVAVAAFVETDWQPDTENDAKPILRRSLAARGVVTQFLDSNWTPGRPRKRTSNGVATVVEPRDEPGLAAARDLFRAAGVIDHRLALAAAGREVVGGLDRPAVLVGLHLRQHTPRRKGSARPSTQLVVRLVALHATPDPDRPWRTETYSDANGWTSYRNGNAAYHAGPIGNDGWTRRELHRQPIRDYVDQALAALDPTSPIVVFVDAEAGRGIWPGLHNEGFGRGALPGSALGLTDLAVVRVASGEGAPQPTHRSHGAEPADPYQPALPGSTLYVHKEGEVNSWLLAQRSRVFRSQQIGARAGAAYTRWSLPEARADWAGHDWHGLTAIEIAVAASGCWSEEQLAALTARLCHQAAAWDDRTRHPTPLHLAVRSDRDHPHHHDGDQDGSSA